MTLALVLALAAAAPPEVRVGSKAFTESIVLGEVVARTVAASGTPAVHRRALGGTRVLWEALRQGEIDLYPEYTGTLAREILAGQPIGDDAALRRALAAEGVGVAATLGFENTYALGMRRADAERLGVRTISDLLRHPRLRFGFTNEFVDRADGWPALRARYGLSPPSARGLDHDLAYRALASGELDVIDLYSTDAQIAQLELTVLEDDRAAFPRYDAVIVHRLDLGERAPAALAATRRLEGAITARQMIAMNARAQIAQADPGEVAMAFVAERLGIASSAAPDGRTRRVAGRTLEHLVLVGASPWPARSWPPCPSGSWPRAARARAGSCWRSRGWCRPSPPSRCSSS